MRLSTRVTSPASVICAPSPTPFAGVAVSTWCVASARMTCSKPGQRVVAHVEAQHVALEGEQRLLVPFGHDGHLDHHAAAQVGVVAKQVELARRLLPLHANDGVDRLSWIALSARRVWPSESKAPAFTRESIVRLLHTDAGTL